MKGRGYIRRELCKFVCYYAGAQLNSYLIHVQNRSLYPSFLLVTTCHFRQFVPLPRLASFRMARVIPSVISLPIYPFLSLESFNQGPVKFRT